jgi:hypothetical protein
MGKVTQPAKKPFQQVSGVESNHFVKLAAHKRKGHFETVKPARLQGRIVYWQLVLKNVF